MTLREVNKERLENLARAFWGEGIALEEDQVFYPFEVEWLIEDYIKLYGKMNGKYYTLTGFYRYDDVYLYSWDLKEVEEKETSLIDWAEILNSISQLFAVEEIDGFVPNCLDIIDDDRFRIEGYNKQTEKEDYLTGLISSSGIALNVVTTSAG